MVENLETKTPRVKILFVMIDGLGDYTYASLGGKS